MSLLVDERDLEKHEIEFSSDLLGFDFRSFVRENRIIPGINQSSLDYYVENTPGLSQKQIDLINAIKENGISSIFEIRSKNKQTFTLYCLTNEKEYDKVFPPQKILFYRHVVAGEFIDGMVVKFENNYYLLDGFALNSERVEVITRASILLRSKPWMLCQDNEQKCEKVNQLINKIYTKFIEVFDQDTIITMEEPGSLFVDQFLSYITTDDEEYIEDINELIELPEKYVYYDFEEMKFETEEEFEDFYENSHKNNVGIFVDKQGGLYHVTGYGTFEKIFESSDYESMEDYESCIKDFILGREVDYPSVAILKIYNEIEDKENFLKIIKDVLKMPELQDMDLLEILKIYKEYDPDKRQISALTLPLLSETLQEDEINDEIEFDSLFDGDDEESDNEDNEENEEEEEEDKEKEQVKPRKIGRNEPCPCGSGKKYKKCCLED